MISRLIFVLGVFGGVLGLRGADAGARPDPRLGAPFAVRERAVLGSDAATVVVIEFSSFKCAHCRTFHEDIFPQLRKRYVDTGLIQWTIVNTSNEPSDRDDPRFLLARAALQAGRYWDWLDRLYRSGSDRPEEFAAWVGQLPPQGDVPWAVRAEDTAVREAVAADFAEYAALRLRGTPTFLLRKRDRTGRWRRAIVEDLHPLSYFEATFQRLIQEP